MKFCFYSGFNNALKTQGLESTARYAAENGFSAVEFLELEHPDWYHAIESTEQAKQTRKTLVRYGLTTACYSVAVNLLDSEKAEKKLIRNVEFAAELNSPYLHHTLVDWLELPQDAPSFEEIFDRVADSATRVALYAKKLGVSCLYEEQGMYFNGVENFGKFFTEIKKRTDNVGVCGDLGNIFFVDETPEHFFGNFGGDIKHVHLKDYIRTTDLSDKPDPQAWLKSRDGNFLKDVPLGEGIVDFNACFETLKKTDYDGVFSLETVDPMKNNAFAMAFAKALYESSQ